MSKCLQLNAMKQPGSAYYFKHLGQSTTGFSDQFHPHSGASSRLIARCPVGIDGRVTAVSQTAGRPLPPPSLPPSVVGVWAAAVAARCCWRYRSSQPADRAGRAGPPYGRRAVGRAAPAAAAAAVSRSSRLGRSGDGGRRRWT